VMDVRRKPSIRFKQSGQMAHFVEYQRMVAVVRKTTKEIKRNSWKEFCQSINQHTPMKEVWQKAKAFRLNSRSHKSCPTLEHLHQFADSYAPPYVPEKHEIHLPAYPSPLNITPTSHQRKNADFLYSAIFYVH